MKTTIASNVPPLYFDEVLIERVLCNLLENAAKYSIASSQIEVKVESVDPVVRISVVDSGLGFSQDPNQLFNMFTRGLSDTNQSGVGLGLAICKEIVQAHGGSISAHNNESRPGSTLMFTLPISENPGLPIL